MYCKFPLLCCVLLLAFGDTCQAGQLYFVTRASNGDNHPIRDIGALVPHVAAVAVYDNGRVEWLHFGVVRDKAERKKASQFKAARGDIRTNSFLINHLVGFQVDDATIRASFQRARAKFANSVYHTPNRDCINCAISIAQGCGLRCKNDYGIPWTFFQGIKKNGYFMLRKDLDDAPPSMIPWN